MAEQKPSFFRSVVSGISGYFKGAVSGGVVGAIGGAAIGAVATAALLVATGGMGAPGAAAAIGEFAIGGAAIGGSLLASIGAIAGITTGVVRSRETHQHSSEDIAKVANVALVQGIAIGQAQAQQQQQPQTELASAAMDTGSKWQDAEKVRAVARAAVQIS